MLFTFCTSSVLLSAQKVLPKEFVKTLDNKTVSVQSFLDKPLVISFWSTCCKPCISELSEIADVYDDWQDEVKFNFLAVSVDDARSVAKVKSLVNGKDWPFAVALDDNQAIKRALNVVAIPHIFVFNKKGDLVYEHQGYTPGSEDEVFEQLKKMQ